MRTILVCFTIIICCIILTDYHPNSITSPVEEMYHKQLVVTLDSILDARFGASCCEEVIDSDDVSVIHDEFGRIILPDK